MRQNQLVHLHVHFGNQGATVGLLVSKTFPIDFSMTVHGPDEFYNVIEQRLLDKIEGAHFIVCISQYTRSQLMRLSQPKDWDKIIVVPLGVDPERFNPALKFQKTTSFEILCIGRLVPFKGQLTLIQAFKEIQNKGFPITLRIIGDGPDRQKLEKLIQPGITFEGSVSQDRIRDFYAKADLFVLPSFAEGIPVVLMEAMSMEIPCVTTFVNGIPELIQDRVDGLLIAPSDVNALEEAILKLYNEPEIRQTIAKAGRNKILSKYNLNENVNLLAEVFRENVRKTDVV